MVTNQEDPRRGEEGEQEATEGKRGIFKTRGPLHGIIYGDEAAKEQSNEAGLKWQGYGEAGVR